MAGTLNAMTPAALNNEYGTTCRPCIAATITVKGCVDKSLARTSGKMNWAQAKRNVITAVDASAGTVNGIIIILKICILDAPSTAAASSIALGKDCMKLYKIHVASGRNPDT